MAYQQVTLNSGSGGSKVDTIPVSDGSVMPASALAVSPDGVQDPAPVTGTNPLPTVDAYANGALDELRLSFASVLDVLTQLYANSISSSVPNLRPFGTQSVPTSTGQAKSTAGSLHSIYVDNVAGSNWVYVWLCDDVSGNTPSTSTLLLTPLGVAPGTAQTYDERFFGAGGLVFAKSLIWGISTTKNAYAQDATTHYVSGMVA